MKKMMLMAMAVVLCAIGAQAAAVNWNVSLLKTANPDNTMSATALSGAIVYGFLNDNGLNRAAAIAALSTGAGAFDTWYGALAADQKLASALTSTAGLASQLGVGTVTPSAAHTVFLVIFDAATAAGSQNYMLTALQTQTYGATGNKTYSFGAPGGVYVPGTWTDMVPEPTSMALLALGAAVVGLRRKFRK